RAVRRHVREVHREAEKHAGRRRLAARSFADVLRQRHGQLERACHRSAADAGDGRRQRAQRQPPHRPAAEDRDRQPVAVGRQPVRGADGDVRREQRPRRSVLMSAGALRPQRAALLIPLFAVALAASDGTTDLHRAISVDAPAENVEALIKAGADVNAKNRYGVTPLSLAAAGGDARILRLLLEAGASLKAADASLSDGRTLLMLAARTGRVDAIRLLVDKGANVNAAETRTGSTALMWAAAENRAEAVRALVSAGADVNARSKVTAYPHTPPGVIGDALEEGYSYVGQTVLPRGGWTALMYAARQGALDAARALAESGADLRSADPDGTPALTFAIINGHYDLAALLIEKGADVDQPDRTGATPLYSAVDMHTLVTSFGRPELPRAITEGSVPMAKTLLAHGADPDRTLKTR